MPAPEVCPSALATGARGSTRTPKPGPATQGTQGVPKRFYSERDLAAVLGVSVKTIQGWRFRSQGPPWKKLAGTVRYPVASFDEWVAAAPGGGGR
jgi:hypothetical protein